MKNIMCQNCSTLYDVSELDTLDDVLERVAPGETMPWGQCPDQECGAVCYPVSPQESEPLTMWSVRNASEKGVCLDFPAISEGHAVNIAKAYAEGTFDTYQVIRTIKTETVLGEYKNVEVDA